MNNISFANGSAIFFAALLTLVMPTKGWAHTSLTSSIPANGQAVAEVSQLSLEFGAPLRLMSISLTDAAGKNIALEFKRSVTTQSRFVVPTNAALPASSYQVSWMGMGDDGHKLEGDFSFVVDPNAVTLTASSTAKPEISLFSGLQHPAAKAVLDFHAALKTGDTDAVIRLLASDVVIFEGGGVERSSAEYQSHHMAADIAFLKEMSIESVEHHVVVHGGSALSLARSNVSGVYKGKPIAHTGMETITLQQRNGNWQITHIHWSK
ncbi:copper resistance protein CopC [Arsukibacterium sp.]|uniref:copper resistance protein CopC n=1 Tax=Arsukibacterium sp. TaxID=1977258 RepID=UPI001BD2253F|nr:copper resistance protein CopC [Arsukibacterium sp.]